MLGENFAYPADKCINCKLYLPLKVVVRYLDIGTQEEVSKETHFYMVPKSNLTAFPFQVCVRERNFLVTAYLKIYV